MERNCRPVASVIVLTRNGMPLVERCIRAVLAQSTPWPFEVIIVDSGSTDGTWEFVETLPIRRMRIRPTDFNHGSTRNLGAQNSCADFLVFLVQDAIPTDNRWLANLVSACTLPNVAGSYSRQIVRPDSSLITHYMCMGTTPTDTAREIKNLPPGRRLVELRAREQFHLSLFQNASSCLRRDVWIKYPFAKLAYGEDIEWGKRLIEAGYSIVYEPSSTVYHSHDRSPFYALKRAYADHYQATELFDLRMVPSLYRMLRLSMWSTWQGWCYIGRTSATLPEKVESSLLAPLFLSSHAVGQYLGSHLYQWAPRWNWARRLDRALRRGV